MPAISRTKSGATIANSTRFAPRSPRFIGPLHHSLITARSTSSGYLCPTRTGWASGPRRPRAGRSNASSGRGSACRATSPSSFHRASTQFRAGAAVACTSARFIVVVITRGAISAASSRRTPAAPSSTGRRIERRPCTYSGSRAWRLCASSSSVEAAKPNAAPATAAAARLNPSNSRPPPRPRRHACTTTTARMARPAHQARVLSSQRGRA